MSLAIKCLKLWNKSLITNIAKRCLSTVNTSVIPRVQPPLLCQTANWIYQERDPLNLPVKIITDLRLPNGLIWNPPVDEPNLNKEIEEPSNVNNNDKHAARLIVIRRKKMKKHKLKKLRKRLKYERAKIRQRRELKKEKEFQARLIAQYKKAEAFSAEEYVAERIREYTKEPPVPFCMTDEYKELMRRKRLRLDVNPKL